MKKVLLIIPILILTFNLSFGQNCLPSSFEAAFRPNNVATKVRGSGDIIAPGEYYTITQNSCDLQQQPSTVFASAIWMGVKTSNDEIKVAGTTYRFDDGEFDWYPGPLNENGNTTEGNCLNWDKAFQINVEDVKKLKNNYENNIFMGTNCSTIPQTVKYWPANGNPYWREKYGFDLPSQELATFYDYDNDGLYDPCKGDLPSLNFLSQNDLLKTPENIINNFPSQLLFWIINDNGGIHKLTSGDNINMELHIYAYGFKDDKDIDNTSFFHIRTLYKGESDLNEVFLSLWVDPDLGCYTDDYIGTDVTNKMAYVYNTDAIDGTNGSDCEGGKATFGDKVPLVGFQIVEGLKSSDSNNLEDLGLTSCIVTNNSSQGNPEPSTTDPNSNDNQFYNVIKGCWKTGEVVTKGGSGYNPGSTDTIKYMFSDAPNDANGWSMCTANISLGDRRVLISTGGNINMKKGDINDAVFAFIYQPTSILPCPSIKPLQKIAEKVKNFHVTQYKSDEGPDAPEVNYSAKNKKIVLKLNNDFPGSNNKNLGFTSKVEGIDAFYKFEGYKVYQLNDACLSSNLADTTVSKLILQYDLQNSVTDVYNWEDEGYGLNKVLKVSGSNVGVPDSIVIDYDYLNNAALVNGKTYYYEVIAYGHNNYMDYDSTSDMGQKQAYIEGSGNRKVYHITPILQNENKNLDVQIIRIKGELVSRFNSLQPDFDPFLFDLENSIVDDTIAYQKGHGPFSVSITDENKIDTSITYKLSFKGEFNKANATCSYDDSTLSFEVSNDNTGEVLVPNTLVNGRNDISLSDIGMEMNIYFGDDANKYKDQSNNVKISYADENGSKWFNALKNNTNSVKSNEENILDPVENQARDKSSLDLPINLNEFFPFANSKYKLDSNLLNFITPTSIEAHGVMFIPYEEANLKELNNVQLVLTKDKSKWSRCIVTESCQSYLTKNGLTTTLDGAKMLETRSTPSVDKNGNPDNSGTNGFSWFPGYAYDIEKGERLNVFFSENTCLRDISGYEVSSTDMIFNPNDVTIAEGINDFRKYVVGGHHFIYITRQKYDECQQLSTILKNGSSSFSKRNAMSAITWAAVPVLNKSQSLLPIEQGLIPNDVVVDLRTTNSLSREKFVTDLTKILNCNIEADEPSYLLKIGKKSLINDVKNIALDNDLIQIKSGVNHFSVTNLNAPAQIELFNINGTKLESYRTKNPAFYWQADSRLSTGMYIITAKDINGRMTSGKVIVVK